MKKFLVGVADVRGYDENDNLIFTGKTLLDSSVETALANTDVRAGRGNALQYIYYHSADMKVVINDAQFSLEYLALNIGSSITTGENIYEEENVTLSAGGAGTVTYTPLKIQGTTAYGWVTLIDGTVQRVTFTGSNFTCSGTSGDVVCVRYYALNSAARSITVQANMLPAIIRLVMETQLASSESSTNVIGRVQIIVPRGSLQGAFTLAMKPDGVSSTPLSIRALASVDLSVEGCTTNSIYAKIIEIVDAANWYDNVYALAIVGGDITIPALGTKQLYLRAIPTSGAAFTPPAADITWSSDTPAKATVSSTGLVTNVATGTATIKATITAKTSVDANIIVTCS